MGSAPAQAGTRAPFPPHRTIGHLPRGLELLARRHEEGGARPRRSKAPLRETRPRGARLIRNGSLDFHIT